MTRITAPFRHARREDAVEMAELVNIAGDGLPLHLWAEKARPEQSAWDVGRERARLGQGGFAYDNTVIREGEGKIAACLIGYPLDDEPKPPDEAVFPILVPLQELGDLVSETWYINILATFPEHRGKGFGTELLRMAEMLACDSPKKRISLIASDANAAALRLYERNGYAAFATRPIVKESWDHSGQNWLLMVKDF